MSRRQTTQRSFPRARLRTVLGGSAVAAVLAAGGAMAAHADTSKPAPAPAQVVPRAAAPADAPAPAQSVPARPAPAPAPAPAQSLPARPAPAPAQAPVRSAPAPAEPAAAPPVTVPSQATVPAPVPAK